MKRYSGDLLAILGKKRKEAAALRNNAYEVQMIDAHDIIPNSKNFYGIREVEELATRMKISGHITPLEVVARDGDPGKYTLISGERRRAAMLYRLEQGEIEKAEAEAKEKRIRHMDNQKEIITRSESIVKAGNSDAKHPIKVADVSKETQDRFLDREVALWTELYKMYNPGADDEFCTKMADALITRFAKTYYSSGDAVLDSFAKVPEEERRSWISRFHENSLYLFGQLALMGNDNERQILSEKRYAPVLSAELYRRYPEYEADTLAEMPVCIRFIRGAESELESSSVGYRYKMKDGQVFIIPSDIVKTAEDFNGFVIKGTKGWTRRYVLYASKGNDIMTLAEIESDAVAANERFYKQIVELFSK